MRRREDLDRDEVGWPRDRKRTTRHVAPWLVAVLLLVVVLPADVGGQEWVVAPSPAPEGDQRAPRIAKPPEDLFSINGAFLSVLQWIAKSDAAQGSVFGGGSLGVTVTVRPSDTTRIFVDFQGAIGPGPDQELGTLSRVNKRADDLQGKDKTLRLMKLILRPSWLEDRVLLSIGKLDVEDYFDRNAFAEDEETQFLNAALLTSPMLRPPPNGPGVALRVTVGDWRYGFSVHGLEDVDGDQSGLPFVIGEVGYRNIFALRGHYRWWARVASVIEDRDRVTWGTGVSIDQLLTPTLGVFFRAGLSRSQGDSVTSHAWSLGLQLTPTWFDRAKDVLGVGYSEQRESGGRERVAEIYYRLTAADWFSLIANVQWIVSGPNAVTGGPNRDVVVPGLRALLSF